MPELELVDGRAIDLAAPARHLPAALWMSPCGGFVGYPTGDAIAVRALTDGLPEVARVALPPGVALRDAPVGWGPRREGLAAGAVGPGARRLALATHAAVWTYDHRGWRSLALHASLDELESGEIEDEDARWLGEPDALAFDRGGGLWLAATHIEGRERVTHIDPDALAIAGFAELDDTAYPDPVHVALVPGDGRVGVTVACGQDGCAAHDAVALGAAVTVVPAVRFGPAAAQHLGWTADGARLVASWRALWRIDPDAPHRRAAIEVDHDLPAVRVGEVIACIGGDGAALHDVQTLAPVGATRVRGTVFHGAGDLLLTAGWGLEYGQIWLYRLIA